MEANKDAALNYIELAEKAIQTNDYEKASRFLNKAESLFPTRKAKDLLQRLSSESSDSRNTNRSENSTSKPSTNGTESTTNDNQSGFRHRATSNSNQSSSNDYTPEEAEAVKKIKNGKDFYEILGVSKNANEADLKKAYRKLALQFHPDKCKAPGATEAFKAIGKAFSVLSDPNKREQYDRFGSAMEPQNERTSRSRNARGGQQYYYYADDDEDFSAEEIFNMFFGYGGPSSRVYRHRQQGSPFHFTTNSNHNHTQANTHTIIQILPYLLLFLISILGSFFVSEPQFQLHRTSKYSTLRTTRLYSVEYFVKSDFRPPKKDVELDKFESSVIEEYVTELRQQCYREQQYKESLLWRARMMNDNNLYREAQKQGTPSCTNFNEFVSRLRG